MHPYDEIDWEEIRRENLRDEARDAANEIHTSEDYEPGICPTCSGSGEGMYDGSTCRTCHGRGES